jgi:superfamily I DNA/RNA helicase
MFELRRIAFTGPAGVGKTHRLVDTVRDEALANPLKPHQSLLALTFMHGARRRLSRKLAERVGGGTRLDCMTIDSFALSLVRRYRRHLGMKGLIDVSSESGNKWEQQDGTHRAGFALVRTSAVILLSFPEVRAAVQAAHPILVVDEFQDCDDSLLDFVRSLVDLCSAFVAADEFQALSALAEPSAVQWLRSAFNVQGLDYNRRTQEKALLRTARALRDNEKVDGGVEVIVCPTSQRAGFRIASQHLWKKWPHSRTVLLSAAGPSRAPFTREVLDLVRHPLVTAKHKFPAYPYTWAASHKEETDTLLEHIRSLGTGVDVSELPRTTDQPLLSEVFQRCAAQCRIRGQRAIDAEALARLAERALATLHAHSSIGDSEGQLAMTIHSAKNREFENVIVLWPYERTTEPLLQRKLLYNAVTRAKKHALILVQGDERKLRNDPVLSLIWTPSPPHAPNTTRRRRASQAPVAR